MKNLISFITLLIFIQSVTDHIITTEGKEGSPDPVLDTNGNELREGNRYDVRPAMPDTGGGVALLVLPPFNRSCTYVVGQAESFSQLGNSLTFGPVKSEKGGVILQSTDLNILFPRVSGCGPSVWKVDEYDESAEQYFLMTGGVEGNPGSETISNWFKIEKVASGYNHYKIVFCPTVCDLCAVVCSDVGVVVHNGIRRLALIDAPLVTMFQRF